MRELDLGGKWTVRQVGGEMKVKGSIAASVPGCVHTDLMAAKLLTDPFVRENEIEQQWVSWADWQYAREFACDRQLLAADRVLLRCEGLDTFASLILNGKKLGDTDNQFRTYEFEVKKLLKPAGNRLEIRFTSTLPFLKKANQKEFLAATKHVPWEAEGRGHVRKSPCQYGWDWGIATPTVGVCRPIKLVAFSTARLTETQIRQDHSKKGVVGLSVGVKAQVLGKAELTAVVKVALDGKPVAETTVKLKAGAGLAKLAVKNPRLWWPNGMGERPLYQVSVELRDAAGDTLDQDTKKIGLRTLRLDRHKDKWGESFQFVVNGLPFFAKGANWIPADAFPTRIADSWYRYLLESSAQANMNFIRVWGGGLYEADVFYEICDELGLCVWQDFMFACASYPTDEKFLASVRAEAVDNLRRIRHHASIAFYCGNNELEQCRFVEDKKKSQRRGIMSWPEYKKIFDQLLPEVVRECDPDRDYWPSSACSIGNREDANNPNEGDAHLWGVWHGREPFEWYRKCEHRFNSEFGFQSFPEPLTVEGYTAPGDRNVTHAVMEHHQRSGIGNGTIMSYMTSWFQMPKDFASTLWLSQIQQGMAIKYAVEHWRRSMPRGMGTIYWQVNDNWPVASWASIDYHGRWKALHYMARDFFAPLLVSGLEDQAAGTVEVHVTSDLLENSSARLAWQVTDAAGAVLAKGGKVVRAAARKNTKVETLKLKKLLDKQGPRDLLVWLELSAGGQTVSRNLVTFARPKHLQLENPQLATTVTAKADGSFAVKIKARKPALWVWLELAGRPAAYSDGFFHLSAGEERVVVVKPEKKLDLKAFTKALRASSLLDTFVNA